MRKILSVVLEAVKVCSNVLMGALCFLKIDHDVAYLPNAEGGIEQFDYFYSIYEKLVREELQFLVYLALAVMAISVLLSIFTLLAKDNRKIKIASHIIFAVSALFFLVLLFYAMLILQYNY